MIRKFKQIVAMVLVVIMCSYFIPVTVYAEEMELDKIYSYQYSDDVVIECILRDDGVHIKHIGSKIGLTEFTVPSEIHGYPVVAFEKYYDRGHYYSPFFAKESYLQKLILPDSITYLEDSVLSGLNKLTTLKLPSNLKKMPYDLLMGDIKLTRIEIPETVEFIGSRCFRNCCKISEFKALNVKEIESGAFNVTINDLNDAEFVPQRNLYIGNKLERLHTEAFCCNFEKINFDVYIDLTQDELQDVYFYDINPVGWVETESTYEDFVDVYKNCSNVTIHLKDGTVIGDEETSEALLSFEKESSTSTINEPISITAVYTATESPSNIEWSCGDSDVVTFSETSIQGPTETGKENTWWISVMATGMVEGEYDITLNVDENTATTKLVVEDTRSVCFFNKWDAENQIAYFGQNDLTGSQVTDETDTSFLENLENLLGQYVLVESKDREDDLIAPRTLISIEPIETKVGSVTAADTESITIGEETYATPDGLMLPDSYVGEIVLYHVYEGKIKGIEILEKEEGTLTYWNAESREVRIGGSYTLSSLADDETIKFLGETGSRNDTVYYYADSNNFVYRIVEIPNSTKSKFKLGEDNFSFVNSPYDFFDSNEQKVWEEECKEGGIRPWSYAEFLQELGNKANYQITNNSFDRLSHGMGADVVNELAAMRYTTWGGSCYGMSIVMAIRYANQGLLPIKEIAPDDESIQTTYQMEKPNSNWRTEDLINYYHLMYQYPYVDELQLSLSRNAQQNYKDTVDKFLKEIENDDVPIVVAIYAPDNPSTPDENEASAHAVIILDILNENNEYYELKVCDPNYQEFTTMYLYKDGAMQEDGLCGLHIKYNGSTTADSEEMGYNLLYNYIDDLEAMDLRNYFDSSKDYTSKLGGTSYNNPRISVEGRTDVIMASSSESLTYQNGHVETAENVYGPFMNPCNSESNKKIKFLVGTENPEEEYNFKFSTEEEACNVTINIPSWSIKISAEEDIEVKTNNKEKSVSVNSESPTNMSILATWNEASSLPGNRIAIDLTESSAFILSTIEDGIELSGDNLNNSEIVVAKDDEVNVVENNTESNDIIIAKDENDKVIIKDNEEHEHTWDEGVITKEATCTEDGEIVYACTSCEETKTEVIKATGHDYHNGVCSKCGDKQASVPVTPVKPVWKSWFEKIIKEWIKHFWR